MVYDKFQARAGQGPCDPYTRQPVKGRARGGGVRMGEMERDGLISHGCAFIGNLLITRKDLTVLATINNRVLYYSDTCTSVQLSFTSLVPIPLEENMCPRGTNRERLCYEATFFTTRA